MLLYFKERINNVTCIKPRATVDKQTKKPSSFIIYFFQNLDAQNITFLSISIAKGLIIKIKDTKLIELSYNLFYTR